ncbi:MAG: efflux RND transporter permease subunit [Armatimonadota bacterium]
MWLTSVAIRRPVFILMVFSALAVLGWTAASRMRVELNPNVDFPFVIVTTVYPGAGPREVETLISKPIEDAVNGINGVKNVTSVSQEGISVVSIEFNLGVDSNVAASDVREKVDALRATLPRDALSPSISKFDINAFPVLYYGMSSDRPSKQLRYIAEEIVSNRLARVPGVASVAVVGGDVREIRVEVDKARLDAYGLNIMQIVQALQMANLNVPSGRVEEERHEYAVRVVGEFANLDQIRNVRIPVTNRMNPMGAPNVIRLADVATVRDDVAERTEGARVNTKSTVGIIVTKATDANTVDVCDGVKREIEQLKKELPRDIEFVLTQDQSKFVIESLTDLRVALFLAIFLAVSVVYLFLHNLRGTFIVSLAIPTSIVSTFLVMNGLGFTLNTMTMLALSLAVGILVDDSIVVLENIFRHLTGGEEPAEAALNGRSEIGLAAITITLVDVVVFVPIAFMGGIVGQFFRAFGITVATATLFSLLVSFTLTPMLASRWFRAGEQVEAKRGLFAAFDRFYHALDRIYRGILERALRRRWLVIGIGNGLLLGILLVIAGSLVGKKFILPSVFVAGFTAVFGFLFWLLALIWRSNRQPLFVAGWGTFIMAGAFFLSGLMGSVIGRPLLPFRFAPDQDQGLIQITVEMPAGTSLAATDRVLTRIEEAIYNTPSIRKDVGSMFTTLGNTTAGIFGTAGRGAQYGEVQITCVEKQSLGDKLVGWVPWGKRHYLRTRPSTEIAEEIRQKIGTIPGAKIKVNAVTGFRGGGGAPIQIELTGQDTELLVRTAERVMAVVSPIEGIVDPDISWKLGKPELQVRVDYDKAASVNMTVAQVASALRTYIEGNTDTKYRDGGKEYNIRVQLTKAQRDDINTVSNLVIGYFNGHPVRLGDVATVEMTTGPTKIDRKNRQRLVTFTAFLKPGYAPGNMQLVIDEALAKANLPPPGVQMKWAGEIQFQREEGSYLGQALLLAIVLVYMLMAALFESLLMPLTIMLSLPQAMIGALLGLIITGNSLNIVSMIGVIMLMGLVTKNAILLVDYTNTLRGRGLPRLQALLEAGPTRLRPILMTTFAMVFGMLPVALAIGRGSEFRAPLGIAVIGGLLLSTLLTLVVIPCVYTVFDDMGNWIARTVFRRGVYPKERVPIREPEVVD